MDAEAKLAALWAEAKPPAHDPQFAAAVMMRVERRLMWGQLLNLVPLMAVVGVLAWALAPAVEAALVAGTEDMSQLATTGLAMALSLILGVWLAFDGSRAVLA